MKYDSIENLPMRLFLKIIETGDLKYLGDQEDLNKTWEKILTEYKELNPQNEFDKILKDQSEIAFNRCKYHALNIAIQGLSIKRNDDLMAILNMYGYVVSDENYDDDLKKCKGYTQAILTKIKKLEEKYNKENKDNNYSFVTTIIKLNRVFGFKIADSNTVTVQEYYELKKEADLIIKESEKQQKNGRGNNYKR